MKTRTLQVTIAAVSGVTAIALASAAAVITFAPQPSEGARANFATAAEAEPWGTDAGFDEFTLFDEAWGTMNTAMNEGDRETFLSFAEGDAVEQLTAWWDESKKLGWDGGYIVPATDEDDNSIAQLGLELPFTPTPVRSSGQADAGQKLLMGSAYTITTTGEGAELRITSFVPAGKEMPWDSGPIYVQKSEHVVLVGSESEKDLVDESLADAESMAVRALETASSLGAEIPQDGFVSAITAEGDLFDEWSSNTVEARVTQAAAVAIPTSRVSQKVDLLAPSIATGTNNAAGYVVMGPLTDGFRKLAFVHEFAHILHFTAAPGDGLFASQATVEGFARYMETVSGEEERDLVTSAVKASVAERGADAMSESQFNSAEANTAYDAAGSYYTFVAEQGGDPWALAVAARTDSAGTAFLGSLPLVGATMDQKFSEENWKAWVASR